MARMQFTDITLGTPEWQADKSADWNHVPMTGRLNPFAIAPNDYGRRRISSGTFVGRRGQGLWQPVISTLDTTLPNALKTVAAASDTILVLYDVAGYQAGDVIDLGEGIETATIAVNGVNTINNTLTLTAGLTNAIPAGASVELDTAVSLTEFFILLNDVVDVDRQQDASFYRHGAAVKVNFLPDYADLDPTVLAQIESLYLTMQGV